MTPRLSGLVFSGSITGKRERRPSTWASSPGDVPRCSTTPIVAGRPAGKAANNSVSAITPPADAPITMTSRLRPSTLNGIRRLDLRERGSPLRLLFQGMCSLDHGLNGETLLPHLVHAPSKPRSVHGLGDGEFVQEILIGIGQLPEQKRG